MKTSELTGAALDWAVEEIENPEPTYYIDDQGLQWEKKYSPSTDWAQGGPIIEREWIDLKQWQGAWTAEFEFLPDDDTHYRYGKGAGPTPLIAAMRCRVASKLGHEVDVPDELC